ncbi:DUF2271 domain-containing protein [Marinobacter lutaoensis]|jgi:hypothetical protein|uniref:Tat pathway signal protein n=1 Tax=Marinobacter lutaoensis TaxID=135739 RepID=A0A1V2DTA2_9GAMM|nr:DUF2271 domain-containing protein [Marinobacter lutaoensis]MBE02870.1 DUF2271 domain-containing protein [Marinobacter sp.]MBI44361.1 DUF2271 domain-containing protein [Oceanospirillales bacterium]NVD37037.1 DUF2271 domain-containing protein [Marinobacter lutaoensis]ONF43893.1 Tat pathway signal protein [Marinobacter lutaoensis]|tara:strand:+ start:4766 stop:5236 length:471 start_codon:yes stop_codon:yes gene_type:complete
MKKILLVLGLVVSVTLPAFAQAREVTFTTELYDYGGDGAYMALYLTDEAGAYQGTLWVAGKKSKYYKHLSGWARGSRLDPAEYDGLTGASITSGRTLKITLDLDDTLFDSGYEVRVDTAVEDMRDNRADIALPLTTDGAGTAVSGHGYVRSFRYDF